MSRRIAILLCGCAAILASCVNPAPCLRVANIHDGPNGHRLITIPAGQYSVGAKGHYTNPLRAVRLEQFRLSDAETTNEQFARFVEATGFVTDAERLTYGLVAREGMIDWAWEEVPGASWRCPRGTNSLGTVLLATHPVTQISGADAEAYCRWIGGRLPTLDEWEVAARAGSTSRWPWGDKFSPRKANVWNGKDHRHNARLDGWVYTSPVRCFPPNAWGLYDVIGNVFEYCADLPPSYRPSDAERLIAGRGGSWWCSAGACNYYNLVDIGAMARHGSLANQGFRVAFDAPANPSTEHK